ncbi:hypothetical protein ACQQ97_02280 [Anaerovoracaceae bacterium SGI.195]
MIYKLRGKGENREVRIRIQRDKDVDITEFSRFCNLEPNHSVFTCENSGRDFVFKIGDRISLSSYLEEERTLEEVLSLLEQCTGFFNFILINGFFLPFVMYDMDRIWISTYGEVSFMYLPTDGMDEGKNLIDFFVELLSKVRASDDSCKNGIEKIIENLMHLSYYDENRIRRIVDTCRDRYLESVYDIGGQIRKGSTNELYKLKQEFNRNMSGNHRDSGSGNYIHNVTTGEILDINPKDVLEINAQNIEFVVRNQ